MASIPLVVASIQWQRDLAKSAFNSTLPRQAQPMKTVQKLASVGGILLFFALCFCMVGFVLNDIRYVIAGRTVDATIISAKKEFAGFANDETGTQPRYRYRVTYSFAAEGIEYGEERTVSELVGNGKSLPVQYLVGSPQTHRILTPAVWVFRIASYAGVAAGTWTAFSMAWGKRKLTPTEELREAGV